MDDFWQWFDAMDEIAAMCPPKWEHYLSFEKRLANRIRVNNYILGRL